MSCVDSVKRELDNVEVIFTARSAMAYSMTTLADPDSDLSNNIDSPEVFSLYTPAMLAELIDVPVQAVRRWYRLGHLQSRQSVRRLPSFDFAEVAVARHLASLFKAGCTLAVIDRKLKQLRNSLPSVARPLSDPSVVVSGSRIVLRRGDELAEPGGQLLMDFDGSEESIEPADAVLSVDVRIAGTLTHDDTGSATLSACNQLQLEALKWEDRGEFSRAAEVYRTLLLAHTPTAEFQFALADLLYRMGDLAAARERFYAAIELDEEYIEARASLGCVLSESGELELAVAAFQGALAIDAEYSEVHYHLANTLNQMEDHAGAELHWRTFLALNPESPWAESTRARLDNIVDECEVLLTL